MPPESLIRILTQNTKNVKLAYERNFKLKLSEMSASELRQAYQNFKKEYDEVCELGIDLDISRGKPNGA